MNQPLPAIRVERATLVNPRPGDRERLTRALGVVTPAATGVPANALLLIRRVRMKRPLAAGAEGFGSELVDQIRAAKASARRGALQTGTGLYFEDAYALEAAMVGAWLAGERLPDVARRSIADCDTPLLRWRRYWLSDTRNLPILIATLVETGKAALWFAQFTEGELVAATERLIRAYGGSAGRGGAVGTAEPRRSEASNIPGATRGATSRPAAIAETIAIARALTSQVAVQCLIAVGLLAVRRPALVATEAFGDARAELSANPVTPRTRRARTASVDPVSPMLDEDGVPMILPSKAPQIDAPRRDECRPVRKAGRPRAGSIAEVSATAHPRLPVRTRTAPEDRAPTPAVSPLIASEYAGLFFLLNIFLSLGLYGDFTDPAHRLRGLSPFELLSMLGRRWIGARFAKDPIDPLLRSLAGLAPRERPGQHFEAPVWETPPDWLAAWEPGVTRAIQSRFGTSRWHRRGFPVSDRWDAARAPAWLRRRWVACLARYIEARLARALGVEDPREAVAMLIARPGEIRIDPEHVEIAFALDIHPLAIRFAGLDRDPGWIPAAGRSVGFRFA